MSKIADPLWAIIDARDATIARLQHMLSEQTQSLTQLESQLQSNVLYKQLEEKEAVIQQLIAAPTIKGKLSAANLKYQLDHAVTEQKHTLQQLTAFTIENQDLRQKLTHLLDEHEKLSQELMQAVAKNRELSEQLSYMQSRPADIRHILPPAPPQQQPSAAVAPDPKKYLVHGAHWLRYRIREIFRPRLGNLCQHAPRQLTMPPGHFKPVKLSASPKISLVTPSFRQAAFIERTIESVLGQHYPNLEYIVQDGGSDDGTPEILRRYAGRLTHWESTPDSGQSQAINRGFARTTGEIMSWLNSDDILLPGTLAYVADYFNQHPEVDVVYGHRFLIDEDDRLIGRWMLPPHHNAVLSWVDYIPQETLFWRRRIWEKTGSHVDESFRFAMDWELLIRFREAGAVFARLPRFIGGFRVHPQQKTSSAITEIGFQEMDRIRQRTLGRIPAGTDIRKAILTYLLRHAMTDLWWRICNKWRMPA